MFDWVLKTSLLIIRKLQKVFTGSIIESKDMRTIFQKREKKGKIFEKLSENAQSLKIF